MSETRSDKALAGARLPPGAPSGLLEELVAREAAPTAGWRENSRFYAQAQSPGEAFFLRWSLDSTDVAVFEHEAAVRRLVGSEGPLRSPLVLAEGPAWLLERAVQPEPWTGDAVEGVAAAAARIADLELPRAPERPALRSASAARRLGLVRRPQLVRELLRARNLIESTGLPTTTGHGDFHAGNILVDGGPWIVDWELSGRFPAGYDLMQFWATAPDEVDRELVFAAAVGVVGRSRRKELARLRYAVLVRTIAAKLTAAHSFDRDQTGARKLLHLLPSAGREADI